MAVDSLALCLCAAALLSAFVAAGAGLARSLGLSRHSAIAAGIATVGLAAGAVLLATGIAPLAGTVVAIMLGGGALIVLVLQRAWRRWRSAVPGALLGLGAALFALGMLYMQGVEEDPFRTAESRFYSSSLPGDDELPRLLADRFVTPAATGYLVGDWLPSDRPPLQAGIVLLFRPFAAPIATILGASASTVDHASSVAAQLLWIPACLAVLAAIGHRRQDAVAAVAVTAVVPVVFVNTVYTWPKELAAAFAIAAVAGIVSGLRGKDSATGSFVLAALLSALAILTHGGAAFVLPVVVAFAAALLWRVPPPRRWLVAIAGILVAVLVSVPWMLYQRLAYPPGDRLLKWHLAGVIPVDDRTFMQALFDQYASTPPLDLLAARLANLGRALTRPRCGRSSTS